MSQLFTRPMRVLTVLQPCAEAMLARRSDGRVLKTWENRPKPAPSTVNPGEWVALHAGLHEWPDAQEIRDLWPECPPRNVTSKPWSTGTMKMGAIVGVWRYDGQMLAAHVTEDREWAFGPWCYRVGESVRLPEPIKWAGAQGWRFLPDPVQAVITSAILAAGHQP